MRRSVALFGIISVIFGSFLTGCDLLDKEVLVDEGQKNIVTDSTTIRELNSVPDSTQLVIETTTNWHAVVSKGGEWCSLSKYDGVKGRDTIHIYVEENTGTLSRQTSIVVESGTNVMIFKLTQSAGETWHDIIYWSRTAAQRMGLHGVVEQFTLTDNWHPNESSIYSFDARGNLLSNKNMDKVANRYDTTRAFTYDEANHRLTCTVTEDMHNTVVRKWKYEYKNTGRFVAYSAKGWNDPDPFAEDMEGMIVPDLSAVYKSWIENNTEYHEDREYVFVESDDKSKLQLFIYMDRWKVVNNERIDMIRDTMRVTYKLFDSKFWLPSTSRDNVTNSTYYSNGMLKMLKTVDCTYDFMDNVQRMVVTSFEYTGDPNSPHEIDSYECDYNSNRDLTERRIRYSGSTDVVVEKYPQYQYDDKHNWTIQYEEIAERSKYLKREFVYYR